MSAAAGIGAMSLVYEVNLEVDAAIAADYRAWLEDHVAQILALPGFTGARIYEVLEPQPPATLVALCVQYTLRGRDDFDAYLREHAPRMRADGVARFGDRFRAERRVLIGSAAHGPHDRDMR
jgi:hypothetical protein